LAELHLMQRGERTRAVAGDGRWEQVVKFLVYSSDFLPRLSYPYERVEAMAAVLNFDQDSGPSRHQADAGIAVAVAHVSHLPARIAVPLLSRYRAQLDAAEALALASVIGTDGNTKAAESIAGKGGKASRSARRRSAKRAAAIKKNAKLADKMAQDELSGEQVDLLADAAEKTGGASLTDEALIGQVAAVDPDKGKSVINDYVAKTSSSDKEQSRHDKQRRQRRVSRFRTKDGCEAVMFAGDRETIDQIWASVSRGANALYNRDGGRDLPLGQHPRTHDQRMFDAAADTLKGPATSFPPSERADCDPTSDARPAKGSTRHSPKITKTQPTIVVGVTLEKYLGLDHDQAAQMIGHGPIADSVLADYVGADPDIVGALFGHDGQLLWLGRTARLASQGQVLGLTIRDKGCVLCSAHHSKCVAHHIMPWSSSNQGRTDIDQLALVCNDCHQRLHQDEQTLYRDRNSGEWKLRPALPHELPAPRPPRPCKGQAPLRT